jgi:hypothetical protein
MLFLVLLRLLRIASSFEVTFDELDNTHNGAMMWHQFGGTNN